MVRPSKLTEWIQCLLRFTPLPKDLCRLIVEYLDDRPRRLICTQGHWSQRDYLQSKGVTILPDSGLIDRLSTATIGSCDSRRVLLKWHRHSTEVIICDPKLGEQRLSSHVEVYQLGSSLTSRIGVNCTWYCNLNVACDPCDPRDGLKRKWESIYTSSVMCTDETCRYFGWMPWMAYRLRLPFYNNCLYELRGEGSNIKLGKMLSIDQDWTITCHAKSIEPLGEGVKGGASPLIIHSIVTTKWSTV